MRNLARRTLLPAAFVLVPVGCASYTAREAPLRPPEIVANDNHVPGGSLRDGILRIELVAGRGDWYPERDEGLPHDVYAFGEPGRSLTNPGPFIRVPAGTEIRATIHNEIVGRELTVHGLHDRPGADQPLTIASGAATTVGFKLTAPGTYFYWGATSGAKTLRDRWGMESQLLGAIVVDSVGASRDEHVFVIGIEDDSGAAPFFRHLRAAVINGRSWPHTGQFSIGQGDTVRSRWINASDRVHPIHLHGFYFEVESKGDIAFDTLYASNRRRLAVTELMAQGQTMSVSWVASRPGNWLMHCHMTEHMHAELRSRPPLPHDGAHNHSLQAMAGIVVGWRVAPSPGADTALAHNAFTSTRAIRLLVQSAPSRYAAEPALGFVLDSRGGAIRADSVDVPGPPLILERDTPVEITVVNRLSEPTSIHWHGIELESYYDGVSGWSGSAGSLAPHVAPNDSFVVRFTPPRAGTFIYHTHFAEERQLTSGMYGALIVLEPGTAHDPERDKLFVFAQHGPGRQARMVVNGADNPIAGLQQGKPHRLRIININPNVPIVVSLTADSAPLRWRAVAKDGADLPPGMATVRPALLRIGVGETYDFEFVPERTGDLALRAVDPLGVVRATAVLRVR